MRASQQRWRDKIHTPLLTVLPIHHYILCIASHCTAQSSYALHLQMYLLLLCWTIQLFCCSVVVYVVHPRHALLYILSCVKERHTNSGQPILNSTFTDTCNIYQKPQLPPSPPPFRAQWCLRLPHILCIYQQFLGSCVYVHTQVRLRSKKDVISAAYFGVVLCSARLMRRD